MSYFVNIDSRFRDTSYYPSPSDFAVSFRQFQGSGPYVNGSPFNNDAFFQQVSIDPDFDESDVKFKNAIITQYFENDTNVYYAGIMNPQISFDPHSEVTTITPSVFSILYKNNVLYSLTGTSQNSFLLKLSVVNNATLPYSFDWLLYTDSKDVRNVMNKASFSFTQNNQIYYAFDFSATKFDLKLTNNFSNINNSFTGTNYILNTVESPAVNLTSNVALFLVEQNGNLGFVNDTLWGYHIFTSDFNIGSMEGNNEDPFYMLLDNSDNLYMSCNINPFSTRLYSINSSGAKDTNIYITPATNFNQSLDLQPYGATIFTATGGIKYLTQAANNVGTFRYNVVDESIGFSFFKLNYGSCQTGPSLQSIVYPCGGTGSQIYYVNGKFIHNNDKTYYVAGLWSGAYTGPQNLAVFNINFYTQSVSVLGQIGTTSAVSIAADFQTGTSNMTVFARNNQNRMTVYNFNLSTNTFSQLATTTFSSSYPIGGQKLNYYKDGNNYYIFAPDYIQVNTKGITNYGNIVLDTVTTVHVFNYNSATGTISQINTFSCYSLDDSNIDYRSPSEIYMITNSNSNPVYQIFDVSDPYNVSLVSTNNIGPSIKKVIPYTANIDGIQKYFFILNSNQQDFISYDATNINNIQQIGYSVKDASWAQAIDFEEGFSYGMPNSETNIPGSKWLTKTPLTFLNPSFKSIHYSKNLQTTISVPTGSNIVRPLLHNDESYALTFSNNNISMYNISNLNSTFNVSNYNYPLDGNPVDCNIINYNSNLYCIVSTSTSLYSFTISPDINSQTYTINNTSTLAYTGPAILINSFKSSYDPDETFGIFYTITTFEESNIARYIFNTATNSFSYDVSLELTPGYKNGASVMWDVFAGKLFYVKNSQVLDGSASANYFILADIPGILLILAVFGAYETVVYPDSSIVVFNKITQKYQHVLAGPKSHSVETSAASKNIEYRYSSSVLISDFTNHTHVTAFSTEQQFVLIQAQTPATGTNTGHVLSVYDLTDPQTPLVISVNSLLTTSRTDAPVYLRFLESTFYKNKATLLCLNDDNTLYLYDITNPYNSSVNQNTLINTTTYDITELGSAVSLKLNQDGNSLSWINSYGSYFTSTGYGQQISISGMVIDASNNNIYLSGNWKNRFEVYELPSTSPVNRITYSSYDNLNKGYFSKCSSFDGQMSWVLPITTPSKGSINDINVLSNGNIIVSGNTESPNLFIYQKQNRGTLTTPTTIQSSNVIPISQISSGILAFNSDGTFQWKSILYSTENNRYVTSNILRSDATSIVLSGFSNANEIKGVDSSNNLIQSMFTDVNPTTQKSQFIHYYNLSGRYVKSQQIEYPENSTIICKQLNLFSGSNSVILTPYVSNTINTGNIKFINKDGTLQTSVSQVINNNISYVSNYLYNSTYTDPLNGSSYSTVQLQSPLEYTFTGSYFKNYNMFLLGQPLDTYLNKNFSIRDNYTTIPLTGTNKYYFALNSLIATDKIIKNPISVNGNSAEYYTMNLSINQLFGMIKYNVDEMPSVDNTINIQEVFSNNTINTSSTYYISFPYTGPTGTIENKIIKVSSITTDPVTGDYTFTFNDINDLRISSPSGSFYGPYLQLNQANPNVYYTLQFFPASIINPIYYTVSCNYVIIPNRALRQPPELGIRNLTDMPYIYIAIYNVNDENRYDREIVNIVYDNNPNREQISIFQIPTVNAASTANWITLSSSTKAKIKFLPTYNNIRVTLYDIYGNPIVFDNTPKSFETFQTVPDNLMQVTANLTFTKI